MALMSFEGIQNTSNKRDIEEGAQQDAVDVIFTNAGGVVARPGNQLALAVANTSAYTTLDGVSYLVSGGVLKRINPDLSLTSIAACTATEFSDYQRYIFTEDGLMVFDETVTNLKVPIPLQPEIVVTAGDKVAGLYSIITTFTNVDGLEGGSSSVVTVELPEGRDILVTPETRDGYVSTVYMTEAGGEVFYEIGTGRAIAASNINANPFPDTTYKLEWYDGRLFVAEKMGDHTIVWFSEPYHYHLFGVKDDYFVLPGRIEAMKSVSQGLIIGTDNAIYLYTEGQLQELAKYGVVPGRSITKLPSDSVLIHTKRGVCSALPFTPLTEDKVSLYAGISCSTSVVYTKGVRTFVALHDSGGEPFNRA